MSRPSRLSQWLARGAAAALAAAVLAPLTISGASAHPGQDEADAGAVAQADAPPGVDWSDYEKLLLTKDTGEPIDLAVLPDSRVLHTARDGVVRLTDPTTGLTTDIAELDVYHNSEDGLQGIALDPNFEENHWIYMAYAPREMSGTSPTGVEYPQTTPSGSAPEQLPDGEDAETYWDQWLGYNVLSRFQFDPETGTLDLDSEQEIIKIDAQRGQCCHVGADIAFDDDGNLYLSTGDNTPAGTPGANGYTPINNAPGMNPGFDSRRGAGNSNDLRGSILRINVLDDIAADAEPGPDSTYTIPEGNLFNSGEYDADLVREEIYVTGVRNPFRIDFDTESGALLWGDYGPDAGSAQDDRGPMGYVEWQVTTEPMNGGWPYCHGPNDGGAYNEWNFEEDVPGEVTFDCANGPVNNSTFNTGLEQLPQVTEPQIWYGDEPGDQPEEWDGLVSFTDEGGQAPMGGPVYRYDAENESTTKFPEIWDGQAFMGEFSQDYVAAFEMDELSSAGEVTDIYNFLPNAHLYEQAVPEWSGIMDMEFGPDGSLYVLEYGKGFFRQNPEAGIYRIDYNPDNKTPRAALVTDQISSSDAPLEVQFDASTSVDPEGEDVTFEWDFEGDGEFVEGEAVESFTYDELGQYTAVVRVTDPDGLFGLAVQEITVGNTAPEISLNIDDGAIFNWGDSVDVSVSVNDAEDGTEPECDRVNWTFGLGHNLHAHPEVSGTGCEFTLETSESAVEHGEGEKIFGSLVVNYTDEPQGDVPATTGEATLTLKPEVQQAEWYDSAEGVNVANDADAGAGSYVTDFEEGDSLTFDPMALTHAPSGEPIDTVTARGSGEGTISLNWEDEVFASFDFSGEAGWQDVTAALEETPEGSGSVVVTSTGGVDLDALTFTASGDGGSEPPLCEDPEAEIGADDEFDGAQVDPCRWEIVDYDADLANVSDGAYHVTTTDADFYGTDNSPVPNILQSKVLTGDQWTVEAAFTADLESAYQQGGIMVRADEDNYVKIDPVYATDDSDTPLRVELRSEVDGEVQNPQDDLTDLALPADGTYYVQLTRDGDAFTGAFSTDGENWQELPSAVSNGQLDDASPGIYALGAQQAEPTTVSFDYFRVVDGEESPAPIAVPVEDVSLQMFSLIPWVDEVGLEVVLERLGEIGFVNIEPFGGNFEGYTAEEFRDLAASYGLSVPSSHYEVDEDSFDATLEFVDTLGQEYVGSGGFAAPGIGSYEDTLATAETMNRLGQRSVEAGVGKFFGHNHDGEFTTTYEHEGEQLSAWEILVAETDPEYVTFELDVAWAAHAGVDVPALIAEYGDRIELLHIKDATGLGGDGSPSFVNLGEGEMALQEILAAAQDTPIAYYALEYDMAADGESFATSGFEYLTGIEAGGPGGEEPVQVTPEEVTFADEPGTADDSFTVPEVEGVQYLLEGEVVEAGTHAGAGSVTITAQALQGYELADGATAEWSFVFTNVDPERLAVPVEDVSLQMFSLIPWVDEVGLEVVLERLGEIGFVNIEPFGGNFEGYTAEEFRDLAASYGLSVPSSHYEVDEDSFDATLEFVDTLGQEYVGSGGFAAPGIGSYEDTLATAETMNRLGQRSVEAGVGKFFGHNHDGEFTTTYEHEGEQLSAWEILVAETDPEYVTFELDVAWAAHAGVDVPALIGEYGDRIELLHIKDATGLGSVDGPSFVNLGEGEMALQEILAAAEDAPIAYYALEYDMAADGESFATSGFEYLTGIAAGQPEPEEPVQVTPQEVTFTDEPGTEDDSFTVPEVEGVQYLTGDEVVEAGTHAGAGSVTVTAQALQGYELAEGATAEWSHTFDTTGGPGELVEVSPEEVTFTDEPGTEDDSFTIPEVEGVEYVLLGESAGASPGPAGARSVFARDIARALVPTPGEVLDPGTYAAQGSVTIIARAAEGYVLGEDATTEWTFEFSTAGEPGEEPTDPGEEPTDPGEDLSDPGADPTDPGADPTGPGAGPSEPGEAPTDGSAGGDLPETGTDVGMLTGLAALLLLVGTGIAIKARRQHA